MAIYFYCHNLRQQPKTQPETTLILGEETAPTVTTMCQVGNTKQGCNVHNGSEFMSFGDAHSGRWHLLILLLLLHLLLPLILGICTVLGFHSLSPV